MDSSSPSSVSASAASPQSHPQNWLAFSLSNHFPSSTSPPSLHQQPDLSLFQSFEASGVSTPQVADVTTTHFTGVRKFEDFLGGGSATTITTPAAPITQFSTDSALNLTDADVYDSELKSIAASFLRGYTSTQQPQVQKASPSPPGTALIPTDPPKKTADSFGQRTSIYRGVTRHRWTGRYEAHLWDNSCRREGQSRKGRQVYLGGYDKEEKAARAYDLAALKYWGTTTTTNFSITNYEKELEEMKNMTRQEFVASLRRKSSGFSRGASIYRGVTRHHQHGRWQARIGRVAGNKDLYLGTFSTQEEAAEAYDIAAIKFRGLNAVTNFDMSRYDVKSIANSNLPIGGLSNKSKTCLDAAVSDSTKIQEGNRSNERDNLSSSSSVVTFASSHPSSSTLSFAVPIKQDPSDYWSLLGYQNPSLQNPKNSTGFVQSLLLPSTSIATPFSMEYSGAASNYCGSESNHRNGFSNASSMFSQQQTGCGTSSPIQFAQPITTISSSHNSSSYEGSSSVFGNWIGPTFQTLQAHHAKPSLCQTPIFGME